MYKTLLGLIIPFILGVDSCTCTPDDFTVKSFNLRYGDDPPVNNWSDRKLLFFDMIDQHQPDIIAFQEAEIDPKINDILIQYPQYQLVPFTIPASDGFGALYGDHVIYNSNRFRVDSSKIIVVNRLDDDTPLGCPIGIYTWHRYITRVQFTDYQAATTFHLYNLHICPTPGFNGNNQKQHVIRLSQELLPGRNIVTGDFNLQENSSFIKYLFGLNTLSFAAVEYVNPTPIENTFRVFNPTRTDVGTFNGFNVNNEFGTLNGKIDYMFSNNFDLVDSDIDHRWEDHENGTATFPSDHFGVYGIFEPKIHESCE